MMGTMMSVIRKVMMVMLLLMIIRVRDEQTGSKRFCLLKFWLIDSLVRLWWSSDGIHDDDAHHDYCTERRDNSIIGWIKVVIVIFRTTLSYLSISYSDIICSFESIMIRSVGALGTHCETWASWWELFWILDDDETWRSGSGSSNDDDGTKEVSSLSVTSSHAYLLF